jgi:hypothetical protein
LSKSIHTGKAKFSLFSSPPKRDGFALCKPQGGEFLQLAHDFFCLGFDLGTVLQLDQFLQALADRLGFGWVGFLKSSSKLL